MKILNKNRVILVAIILIFIVVILPLMFIFQLSKMRTVELEKQTLTAYASQALKRARTTFADATKVLQEFSVGSREPCSATHLREMQLATIKTRNIETIGYVENGFLRCSAWGVEQQPLALPSVNFVMANDISVTINARLGISDNHPMTDLFYRSHIVEIDPVRFVDIFVDPDISLTIATSDGLILGELNHPNPDVAKRAMAAPENTWIDGHLVVVLQSDGFVVVVSELHDKALQALQQQQLMLLPFGILIIVLLVSAVIWYSRRQLSMEAALKLGLERKELIVHYQPIIDLRTQRCVGAEALIRWYLSDGSMIRPDLFIPLAEESGLITAITEHVIETVTEDLKTVLIENPQLHIAINLSAADIKDAKFLKILSASLERTKISPAQLWLEATERGFLDVNAARHTIETLRLNGHFVAIDDFGTGYSSLSYLQGLPLDILKIDKSFIDTIGSKSPTSSVTSHIIDMAKSLGLKIVAEGVENQQQADYLLERGVEFGQGWFYAKAMPKDEFIEYCLTRL